MNDTSLTLPIRKGKPRDTGLTILIDNGLPIQFFLDTINSSSEYIDFIKFGWGTSIITKHLPKKIHCLNENKVNYFFGGTLFEKYVDQGKTDDFYQYCKTHECSFIEISNGTIPMTNKEKATYIRDFSQEFHVISEVGRKDGIESDKHTSSDWIEFIQEDFESGAYKVITETREGGTGGICTRSGDIKFEILESIFSSSISLDKVIFEAPTKNLQALFINELGPNVNLANIPFSDTIPLETLRLGLRSDTFHMVKKVGEVLR
ncbi:phosphosulfolactate synthase [Evansella sp. AB-rgal1]|uniref:phosphosulfolactate synthase n=1 Tax=Evansella sp. AB-rgal1 TaxID=3242696 RepID=UPI00359E9512